MQKQNGFTLIELVIVIVILGILAATALPRFSDLSSDARTAKLNAAFGAIKSAAAIGHATALARNVTNGSITLEGSAYNIINGYPTAQDSNGIVGAAGILASDGFTIDTTNAGSAAGNVILVQVTGAGTQANCQVSYTAPASGAAPTITADTSGC